MDPTSLFSLLNSGQSSGSNPLASLPTGNLGAGGSQPLSLGTLVASNDPGFDKWREQHPEVPEVVASNAYEASKGLPAQHSKPVAPDQTPYMNYASKATGQDYK